MIRDQPEVWDLGDRQAARHVAHQRHAMVAEVEQGRCEQPAGDQHERARDSGGETTQPEDDPERDAADEDRQRVCVTERPHP